MEATYSSATAAALFSPLRRAYLFFGEDDQQKDEAFARLRAGALDESFAEFDFEQIDADTVGADRILSAAFLAPFASPVRLILVRRAEVYRKRELASEAEKLAAGISALGAGTCLVLRASAGEDEAGRGKTALHPRLDSAIKEAGAVVRFRAMGEEQLADWAVAEARRAGKELADEGARVLAQLSGGNRTVLRNELEKAICFTGNSPVIAAATVEAILSHDPEDVAFKLVDAVSQRNPDRALTLFAQLLRYDTKPQSVAGRLLALLARQFSLLWQAKELSQRGVAPQALKSLPPEITAELPSEGSIISLAWKAPEIFRVSRSWSRSTLARAMELVAECDVANKGGTEGSEDVTGNLEVLIVTLCRLTETAGRGI